MVSWHLSGGEALSGGCQMQKPSRGVTCASAQLLNWETPIYANRGKGAFIAGPVGRKGGTGCPRREVRYGIEEHQARQEGQVLLVV